MGGIPASASSFCSSLLTLRGCKDVLNLFSRFTAEEDPSCFALISWVATGTFLPCRNKSGRGRTPVTGAGKAKVVLAPRGRRQGDSCWGMIVAVKDQVPFPIRSGDSQRSNLIGVSGVQC